MRSHFSLSAARDVLGLSFIEAEMETKHSVDVWLL